MRICGLVVRAWLLVACVVLQSSQSSNSDGCPLISDAKKGWLRAPGAKSGLCNQLLGVLSYVPVASLFKLNLIVGSMFTRLSFRERFRAVASTGRTIPLSYFFDWNHYTSNAFSDSNVGIDIIVEEADVDRQCGAGYIDSNTLFVEKRFWPFTPHELMDLVVKQRNVSLPRPPGSILQLGKDLLTTYGFRSRPDRSYANHQLEGLSKLNSSLEQVYDAIVNCLPPQFIAVHLRLEHDAVPTELAEKNHTHFEGLVRNYVTRIAQHFAKHPPLSSEHQSPVVYLSSGIFHHVHEDLFSADSNASDPHSYRAKTVVRALLSAGYAPTWSHHVLSNSTAFSPAPPSAPDRKESTARAQEILNRLGAEQRALIDLFVCKRASEFIPAHSRSSFGYMVGQWRGYERNISLAVVDKFLHEAPGDPLEFKYWGFRS